MSIRPLVATLLERFGTKRVLWGSNYPVEKLARGYDEAIDAVASACGGLTADERGAVFAGNARRLYRLPPAA